MGLSVHDINIEHVVTSTIISARRWGALKQLEGALNVARQVAAINGMSPFSEQLITQYPYHEKTRSRRHILTFGRASGLHGGLA